MDREGFKNRMKQYKEARGLNPLLKYWEWKAQPAEKDIPKYVGGGVVGEDNATYQEVQIKPNESNTYGELINLYENTNIYRNDNTTTFLHGPTYRKFFTEQLKSQLMDENLRERINSQIDWAKSWYNARMAHALATQNQNLYQQLIDAQPYFFPQVEFERGAEYNYKEKRLYPVYTQNIYPSELEQTPVFIDDKMVEGAGSHVGAFYTPERNEIYLRTRSTDSDLLHELFHRFNTHYTSQAERLRNTVDKVNSIGEFLAPYLKNTYWSRPWEIHSRLMEFRKDNNIDPQKKYTEEDVNLLRNDENTVDKTLLEMFDNEQMLYLLNDVADNATTPADDRLFLKNGGVVPKYEEGGEVGDNTDYRQQIINRADYVASNYDDAKDFDLNPLVYTFRKFAKDNFDRGGISNCTLSATGWIDPNNQYMSAKNIFNNPSSGYTKIDAGYALPGDLLIAKNPEKNSYHTMLIEGFNGNEPILRYSRGGHDTKENLVTGRLLSEYHELDNKQGGNHTEDHYFRYNIPNEYWLPELIVTPNKR